MSNTFRELFDQEDREEILRAVQARLGPAQARVKKLKDSERVTDAYLNLDKAEMRVAYLQGLIKRIAEESN